MNTFKLIGYAGVASIALAISANSPTLAESRRDIGTVADKSGNLVHRVSHTLAAAEKYTGSVSSGYKWGENTMRSNRQNTWQGSDTPASGYKWGNYHEETVLTEQSVTPSYSEQTRNPWGRKDFAEQARNPWGRKAFSEQS